MTRSRYDSNSDIAGHRVKIFVLFNESIHFLFHRDSKSKAFVNSLYLCYLLLRGRYALGEGVSQGSKPISWAVDMPRDNSISKCRPHLTGQLTTPFIAAAVVIQTDAKKIRISV
jgi:hypothetical protein